MGTSLPAKRTDTDPPVPRPWLQPTVAFGAVLLVLVALALVVVLRPRGEPTGSGTATPAASRTDATDAGSDSPAATTASARPSPAYRNGAIAFDHGSDVWIMEADGDDARPMVAGAYGIGWSPDGSRLLVVLRDPSTGGEAVAVVGAHGGDPMVLGPGSLGAWSPDGEVVAISNPFGGEAIALVRLSDGADEGSIAGSLPAWSPDGAQVAFLRQAPVEQPCEAEFCPPVPCGLWLHDMAIGNEARVTPDDFGCEYAGPQWSPEGSAIAIGHRVVSVDGTELLAWQEGRSLAAEPWSPDGSMLAAIIADDRMNGRAIEVITVATGERRTVLPQGEAVVLHVGWSPDGQMLVYSAVVTDASGTGTPRIHVVPAGGGGPTTIGPDNAQFPLWQPLASD